MPANTHSVIYLVTTAPGSVTLTLPPASSAASRFVTITRVDNGRQVYVRPQLGDVVDGASTPISMNDRFDSITLVSDGNEWVSLFRQHIAIQCAAWANCSGSAPKATCLVAAFSRFHTLMMAIPTSSDASARSS